MTGASNWIPPETVLRVFRQAVPALARLGVLRSANAGLVSGAEVQAMRDHLAQANAPKVEIVERVVADAPGIPAAVRELLAARVQAIWIPIDITIYQNTMVARDAVGNAGVPLLASSLQGARKGAVAGVLVDYEMLGTRAAALALDVLAGRCKPGDVPVDTMRGYQVIVNLEAARRCGYEVPLSLLVLADVLIDDGEGDRGRR